MFRQFFKGIFGTRKQSNSGKSRNSQTRKKSPIENEISPDLSLSDILLSEIKSPPKSIPNKTRKSPPKYDFKKKVVFTRAKEILLFQSLDRIRDNASLNEDEKKSIMLKLLQTKDKSVKSFVLPEGEVKLQSITAKTHPVLNVNRTFKKSRKSPKLGSIPEAKSF